MERFFAFMGYLFPLAAWFAFAGVCIAALAWLTHKEDNVSWLLAVAILFFGFRAGRASTKQW